MIGAIIGAVAAVVTTAVTVGVSYHQAEEAERRQNALMAEAKAQSEAEGRMMIDDAMATAAAGTTQLRFETEIANRNLELAEQENRAKQDDVNAHFDYQIARADADKLVERQNYNYGTTVE